MSLMTNIMSFYYYSISLRKKRIDLTFLGAFRSSLLILMRSEFKVSSSPLPSSAMFTSGIDHIHTRSSRSCRPILDHPPSTYFNFSPSSRRWIR